MHEPQLSGVVRITHFVKDDIVMNVSLQRFPSMEIIPNFFYEIDESYIYVI